MKPSPCNSVWRPVDKDAEALRQAPACVATKLRSRGNFPDKSLPRLRVKRALTRLFHTREILNLMIIRLRKYQPNLVFLY
jgi:hypothetical protein